VAARSGPRVAPPQICDFDCASADFPPAETAGLCHTMAAVWCRRLRALVRKNVPCEWRRRQEAKRRKVGRQPGR